MTREATGEDLNADLRALVMRARGGDAHAYKQLLTGFAPVIRRMVAARVGRWGGQHYVEDITQDTLLAIHLKLHTYDADMPLLAWVNAVARHKLIDHLRRIKGATVSLDEEGMPELVDGANPEAPGIALDLRKLLGMLKPPAGEIIYALRVEGASVRELAAAHGLSESNIKVIVHRGLQKLSQLARAG
ncbi:MAG: sigma-70 family RNA polymerase sigma factor [Alphaproteobacteria bacterium]|nr:sigma-70 family RNA polymerase sigma factor [Alphaproteobacteria bacterium]